MLHLIDTDTQKHDFGPGSREASDSLLRHDSRLGRLSAALEKAGVREDTSIIIFGDHGCLPVHTAVNPDIDLVKLGLIKSPVPNFYAPGPSAPEPSAPGPSAPKPSIPAPSDCTAYFHCAGGTAFLMVQGKHCVSKSMPPETGASIINSKPFAAQPPDRPGSIRERVASAMLKTPYTKRLLTPEEMKISGMDRYSILGIEAAEGFCFGETHAGQHGYSLMHEGYKVFYLVSGNGVPENEELAGGCITDICPLAADLLGLGPWASDGINRFTGAKQNFSTDERRLLYEN